MYKCKYTKAGETKKYRARLVALRYGQVAEVDVFYTFVPVVKGTSVR